MAASPTCEDMRRPLLHHLALDSDPRHSCPAMTLAPSAHAVAEAPHGHETCPAAAASSRASTAVPCGAPTSTQRIRETYAAVSPVDAQLSMEETGTLTACPAAPVVPPLQRHDGSVATKWARRAPWSSYEEGLQELLNELLVQK
jgi:hypothetical protein